MWNIHQIPEFRRWDDLIYITYGTKAWSAAVNIVKEQLKMDMDSMVRSEKTGISLLGKWMPSENASSQKTIEVARQLRKDLDMTAKQYRKMLSALRERIKVLERLMSANRWDEIEFDKIPSKAGLIYRNAFAEHDITRERYQKFAKDETTKVNAKTLYPYEVVKKALDASFYDYDDAERLMVNKYWDNLEDYFKDKTFNGIAVCDTSGSMTCGEGARPIDVAISLAMYCAERAKGPFQGHYISFSSRPNLVTIHGQDFVEKVFNIYKSNLIDSTNLEAVFDLILNLAMRGQVSAEDMPKNVIVISDMQINAGSYWSENKVLTEMEKIRQHWKMFGFEMPHLVYWNVQASNATILDAGPNVSYVSGCSPVIFESILTGKRGIDLMYDKLNSPRYEVIV